MSSENIKIFFTENIKIFFTVFLISFLGFWGLNLFQSSLEEIFYYQEVTKNPEIFLAEINLRIRQRPKKNLDLVIYNPPKDFDIKARSAMAVLVTPDKETRIIFQKNIKEKRTIASITKLMTAVVAKEIYKPDDIFWISKKAVSQEEERGQLRPGEKLSLDQLLHIMLIESSNDAAQAIAEGKTSSTSTYSNEEYFVELMNKKAREINLGDTFFSNPTGLNGAENYSTSYDLIKMAQYILNNHPEVLEITRKSSWKVLYPDGKLHHFISKNTNKLLEEIPEIVGGKTGYTEEAGGCIILVLRTNDNGYLITVVLGTDSPDSRFVETKKLIEYCETVL